MDAMSLLGSLMGNNAVGGGIGGQLIGGLLGGGGGNPMQNRMGSGGSSGFGKKAMMGVLGGLAVTALMKYAKNRSAGQAQAAMPSDFPETDDVMTNTGYDDNEANSRAEILIRAMVNAAKADGQVDEQEQQNILERVGNLGEEEAEFLRREMQSPLDTQGFIRSIPRGMEQEVYAMSLMGIVLDESSEASYLAELADGMSLSADVCNNIHREAGAPEIFQ